ncbi:MAG: hypothetical protein ACREOO_08820 [bacterium]
MHGFGRSWLVVLTWFCWQTPAPLPANDKLTLHLVYTSDTIGYVDPCG